MSSALAEGIGGLRIALAAGYFEEHAEPQAVQAAARVADTLGASTRATVPHAAEARAESPALLEPLEGVRLHAWVGERERPEFVRQSALIANVWTGLGAETALTIAPGRHHFDVIAELAEPGSALVEALIGTEG